MGGSAGFWFGRSNIAEIIWGVVGKSASRNSSVIANCWYIGVCSSRVTSGGFSGV